MGSIAAVLAVAVGTSPAPGQAPSELGAAGTTGGVPAPPVEVRDLGRIDVDALGSLTLAAGGFGSDAWAGLDRETASGLLAAVPAAIPSPVLRDLVIRLMLTAARPGTGNSPAGLPADMDADPDASFLAERARLLRSIGALEPIFELTAQKPADVVAPAFERVGAEARFLNGDLAAGCRLTAGAMERPGPSDRFWQRALAFCQALAGEDAAARLSVAVLAETGKRDPTFESLIAALAGDKLTLESLPAPDALTLAMARAAGVRLPADVIETADPALLAAVAVAPNAAAELRLRAAETAHAAGALPAELLNTLYANVASGRPSAGGTDPWYERARQFHTALVADGPLGRADAVIAALTAARSADRWLSTASAYRDLVINLEPGEALTDRAPELVRAAAATDAAESVSAWLTLIESAAETNSAALEAATAVTPLVLLLSERRSAPWNVDRWIRRLAGRPAGPEHARLMVALLSGLGLPVPVALAANAEAGLEPITGPRAAPSADPEATRLMMAAEAGQAGETVLRAAALLPAQGVEGAGADRLGAIVLALRTAGFAAEARTLAIHAAAAAGI